jgi:hypothetical protein
MKGVLVDPYLETIKNVEVEDWRDIQKHLQCSIFGSGGYDEGGDAIYVNDEGMFEEDKFVYMPDVYPYPYAGRVLFLGINRANGASQDAFLDAEDVADIDHKFMDRMDVQRMGDLG